VDGVDGARGVARGLHRAGTVGRETQIIETVQQPLQQSATWRRLGGAVGKRQPRIDPRRCVGREMCACGKVVARWLGGLCRRRADFRAESAAFPTLTIALPPPLASRGERGYCPLA
jgi:hypothetical protein